MSATLVRAPKREVARHTTLRIRPKDRAELVDRAQTLGISLTALLVDSALGRLAETDDSVRARLTHVEERLERLEQLAYDG